MKPFVLDLQNMNENALSVAVVENNELLRMELLDLFNVNCIEAKGYDSKISFLDSLQSFLPGCVLIDVHMPAMGDFEIQSILGHISPETQVVLVSEFIAKENPKQMSPRTASLHTHMRPTNGRCLEIHTIGNCTPPGNHYKGSTTAICLSRHRIEKLLFSFF